MADEAFTTQLWTMADLFTPMALRVAATLRLADHIVSGADTVPALVERTSSDPDALNRLVDHLVNIEVLQRDETEILSLTDLGDQLREEHPGNWRAWLDIEGAVGRGDLSALHLLDVVRTGQPAYPLTYGREYWEDLAAQPALSDSFDALMASRLRFEAPQVAASYDWGALSHVVDVGGGNGALLAALLAAHPGLRGTLVDLPGPAKAAHRTFAEAGVSERCAVVPGSFFDALPAGANAYVLSGVIHDWDDANALQILRRCAEAAGTAGRVLVIEDGLTEDTDSGSRTGMDLRMLVYTGGRERTLSELEQLALDAGLRVESLQRLTGYRSMVELRR